MTLCGHEFTVNLLGVDIAEISIRITKYLATIVDFLHNRNQPQNQMNFLDFMM